MTARSVPAVSEKSSAPAAARAPRAQSPQPRASEAPRSAPEAPRTPRETPKADKVEVSSEGPGEPERSLDLNLQALGGQEQPAAEEPGPAAQEAASDSPYTTVTIQKWGSGQNDCVWNALKGAGYTDQEIAQGNLVARVAELNGLKDPNIVHAGQQLRLPRKGEAGDLAAGQAGESQANPAGAGDNRSLQEAVMNRARSEGDKINATGGYRFDGYNDCYGFVRRVWDPILQEQGLGKLPVNDGPNSPNWERITDWDQLKPGDVLATAQGHQWGDRWHGGLYAGKDEQGRHLIYDASSSTGGAHLRPLPRDSYFTHFYRPTHDLLSQGQGGQEAAGPAQDAGAPGEIPQFGPNPTRAQIGLQLEAAAQKYGIPPDMLKAVAWQESTWRANASSFDGGHGKGVMQIDDRYHELARTPQVWDPVTNIDYGASYLASLYRQTGDWNAALRRYNGGASYPAIIRAHMANRPWLAYV
ncbi:MAG TPA: transglycosylase SLT domain-containing protein [Candidatus Nitrosotenuis sp.]|nr:transglycosylase SLT domain-containing protein [Candidatus Nitrosotenuis sp.]